MEYKNLAIQKEICNQLKIIAVENDIKLKDLTAEVLLNFLSNKQNLIKVIEKLNGVHK